jgi:TatD DNase family protein
MRRKVAMKLIDIGANLTHESFASDYLQVIADAKQANVGHIVLTGTDLESSEAAAALTERADGFHTATAGFHPHVAGSMDDAAFCQIRDICQRPRVVAVGETGLDYNRNFSPKKDQLKVFEQHLELAVELKLPLFLHQREAHTDFFRLLKHYRPAIVGGVVHCFTDNEEALRDYLELDMYIGITGWVCDERRGLELQQLVPLIPLNRLLIETDAPYLLPRTLSPMPKSRRNEPKHLIEVAKIIADCCQLSINEIANETTLNANNLFKLQV